MSKVYIVFKGFWMYQAEIYRVFSNLEEARKCLSYLRSLKDVHSYILEKEVLDKYEMH